MRVPAIDPQLAPLASRNIDEDLKKKSKQAKKDVTFTDKMMIFMLTK